MLQCAGCTIIKTKNPPDTTAGRMINLGESPFGDDSPKLIQNYLITLNNLFQRGPFSQLNHIRDALPTT